MTLGVEIAVPAVVLEYPNLVLRESLAVADGHVALDVADGAHAWDDGRDSRMAQNVAERYLGYLIFAGPELGDDGPHAVVDLLFAPAAEVVIAEISLLESGIWCDPARQGTFVEGYPDYDADTVLLAGGEELILRTLVEDVVDHLDRIYHAGLDEPHRVRRLVVVYGDAESADLAFALQVLDRLEPVSMPDPVVLPDVELLHIDGVQPEVHGPVEGLKRFLVLRAKPGVAGDAPGPVAYLRDFQTRPA